MTLTLSGLPYRAVSPSLYYQLHHPVAIAFDGVSWLIGVNDVYGTREFSSRQEAAETVAYAYNHARENLA